MTETKKELTLIDAFRAQISHKDVYNQILNYFGGDEDLTRKFCSSATHVVRTTPKLLACERSSLMEALITCADLRLFPSSASGEAYVIPYKDKAQFQLGYQGIITLLYRAGVASIKANIVYENDIFDYQEGLDSVLHHKPVEFGQKKGKAIGVYAVAVVNGEKLFHVMSEEDVMKYKKFSKSAGSSYSPWDEKSDPEKWMWRKTCIKQLAKILPKNETLSKAIARDNEDSTIGERKSIDVMELKDKAPTMRKLNKENNDSTIDNKKEGPEGAQKTIFSASESSEGPESR